MKQGKKEATKQHNVKGGKIMRKNFKRFLSIMMAVMVIAMAAACGKKEEAAEPAEKEETKVEVEKEEELVEEAADEQQVDDEEPGEPVNEYGFTDSQVENLYKSIEESVKTDYMGQNNISPTEFVWPNENDTTWRYVASKLVNYAGTGDKNRFPDDVDSSFDESLAEPIYIGFINWLESPDNGFDQNRTPRYISAVIAMMEPIYETIPANVTFTE